MSEPPSTITFEHTRSVEVKQFNAPNFAVIVDAKPDSEGVPIKALPRDALDKLALAWITDLHRKADRRPPDLKWDGRGDAR